MSPGFARETPVRFTGAALPGMPGKRYELALTTEPDGRIRARYLVDEHVLMETVTADRQSALEALRKFNPEQIGAILAQWGEA